MLKDACKREAESGKTLERSETQGACNGQTVAANGNASDKRLESITVTLFIGFQGRASARFTHRIRCSFP